VAVLSEPFWKSQFNADHHIVGRAIHLNGLPFTVIGIVPADDANLLIGGVFFPYTLQPVMDRGSNLLASLDSPWLAITARLRQGYSRADAQRWPPFFGNRTALMWSARSPRSIARRRWY
jgi:hypothetical protein